jgi:hypothetical protein
VSADKTSGVTPFTTSTSLITITDEAVNVAAGFLSSDQPQALRQIQMQQPAQRRLFAWLSQLQSPPKSAGGDAP